MKMRKIIILGVVAFVLSSLCACYAAIDDSAANSASSIITVVIEYVFAIGVLFFSLIHRLIRSLSIGTIILGILGELECVNLIVSPTILIAVGIALLISFIIPVKPYYPQVIISRNAKKVAETWKECEEKSGKKSWRREILIGLVVGIVLLLIEYTLFAQ